uniref:Uncharacterized protein n=1 Tax=Arundo donax TaxID=35708 RepID=A0A0A8XVS9_ARUDO
MFFLGQNQDIMKPIATFGKFFYQLHTLVTFFYSAYISN